MGLQTLLLRLMLCLTFIAIIVPTFAKESPLQNGSAVANLQVLGNPFSFDFPDERQPSDKLFPMQLCEGLKLEEATIDQLQHWMTSGKLTTQQLVACYVQRITQTDRYVRYDSLTLLIPPENLKCHLGSGADHPSKRYLGAESRLHEDCKAT